MAQPDNAWHSRNVLITVRTYPVPAKTGVEVSCTAGVTDDGKWIRLFPIPYRFLNPDQHYAKYNWVQARVQKAPLDRRPESFRVDRDSIKVVSHVGTDQKWRERRRMVGKLIAPSFCAIEATRNASGAPTLGLFKPREIQALDIEVEQNQRWSASELQKLRQQQLFDESPTEELEKIPYVFRYRFTCDEDGCPGHNLRCTDWEMAETYRQWRWSYGFEWETKFKEKWLEEMSQLDTHFYVGNVHRFPSIWLIVGLFYPPQTMQPGLDL